MREEMRRKNTHNAHRYYNMYLYLGSIVLFFSENPEDCYPNPPCGSKRLYFLLSITTYFSFSNNIHYYSLSSITWLYYFLAWSVLSFLLLFLALSFSKLMNDHGAQWTGSLYHCRSQVLWASYSSGEFTFVFRHFIGLNKNRFRKVN